MAVEAPSPDIHELLKAKNFAALKSALAAMEIHDLTELVASLEDEQQGIVLSLLPLETATEIFGDLPLEHQEDLYASLSSEKFAAILNELPPDERTDFLEELPEEIAERLLTSLSGNEQKVALDLMAYPEESIGRLMTTEFVAVREDWSVEQVFRHIRKVAAKKETVNVIYVVDKDSRLLDDIPLEELVLADPDAEVKDLMDAQTPLLQASDDREAAVEIFKKYNAVALPAIDDKGVLVGIVTVDDVLDVAEEEDTEDFQKMSAVTPLEHSYFGTGFFGMLGKRLPWLAMLALVETLAVMALDSYKGYLVMLGMFVPLINATAGNTGNQVAGLMIRGFAVQEVALSDWWRVLVREIGRGLTMGLLLAVMAVAIVLVMEKGSENATSIAIAVSAAMVLAVTLANVCGAMLPFFFCRVGVDPAVTSGPFIACLMDVLSILIFFSIAVAILGQAS